MKEILEKARIWAKENNLNFEPSRVEIYEECILLATTEGYNTRDFEISKELFLSWL